MTAILGAVAVASTLTLSGLVLLLYSVTKNTASESGMRSKQWSVLKDGLVGAATTVADGAAADHAHGARKEAARKLIMNHDRVLHDLTRADGPPKTQPHLKRLPGKEREVDAALHELARRLYGRLPAQTFRPVKPATEEQATAWHAAAEYLSGRLQSTAQEVARTRGHEQREPDMSEDAAAAMKAVLAEIAAEEAASYTHKLRTSVKQVFKPFASSAGAIRPAAQVGP